MRTLLLLCVLPVSAVFAEGELDALRRRMVAAKNKVFPALVHIVNVEEAFQGGRRQKSVSSGSGFLIDTEGHIVTNYHVAGQGRVLVVTLASKQKVEARHVAGDPFTDLAVLKVDPKKAFPHGPPPHTKFGDSDRLEEGDFVMAMGSPLSLSRSVSFGIVSCRERALGTLGLGGQETGKYNTWLQTDAAINPGNSGGPLVNLAGEVIGVNTRANLIANNIGFAIPSNVARDVVTALIKYGRVARSYLGLKLQPVEELEDSALEAGAEGVLVAAVEPGSPADRAGIRPGDLITRLAGRPFKARFAEEIPNLYNRIAKAPAGKDVTISLRRQGVEVDLKVRPVVLGRQLGRETEIKTWGITVQGITARMKVELRLSDTKGVLVTGIRAGGPAATKLERGDIIRDVQGSEVEDFAGFLKLVTESIRQRDEIVRIIVRRGSMLDVTVLRPREKRG